MQYPDCFLRKKARKNKIIMVAERWGEGGIKKKALK